MASIEPTVTSWTEAQIHSLGWEHGPQQNGRDLDIRVDEALRKAPTKSGGKGVTKPDHVIILDDGAVRIPVVCEWKGTKGNFRDQLEVELRDSEGRMRYGSKGIDRYASLGAAYYASRIVGPTGHGMALALAVNGYFRAPSDSEPVYEVALYVVSKHDTENVRWIGDYEDLSVLDKDNFKNLLQDIEEALDPDAAVSKKAHKAESLDAALKRLNEFLHTEHGIIPSHRVNVIAALMISSLGVLDDGGNVIVRPLVDDDLYGGHENGSDGAIIFRKVEDYLKQRRPSLPIDKQESVLNALRPTLLDKSLSKKGPSGMSALKSAFHIVSHGLLPHYHDDRAIDFAGKLFNEMYAWIDVPDAGANDVVLTPKRTTDLMVEITQVNSDSYVWDWTLGTGAFLVSAMNVMLADARQRYDGQALREKELQIKMEQLLGIEKLGSIYVLAILNMILMGDGASNIIHGDSHNFDGLYQKREGQEQKTFPATTLVLNPPYSAPGNGLIFVEEAFAMMAERETGQYGAVLIQDSAGLGKAIDYCQEILKKSTLVASIKMPKDLFIGKSGVQTSIYFFKVGTPHHKDHLVKFIDFRNDGHKRSSRRKVKDPSTNLRPVDNPDARYAEVAAIVTGRKYDTNYYPEGQYYFQDTIDPTSGTDWNFEVHVKIDAKPVYADFERAISDFLEWEFSQILTVGDKTTAKIQVASVLKNFDLTKTEEVALQNFDDKEFAHFKVGGEDGLFEINPTKASSKAKSAQVLTPIISNTSQSNGVQAYDAIEANNPGNIITFSDTTDSIYTVFYQPVPFAGYSHVQAMTPNRYELTPSTGFFFIAAFRRAIGTRFDWATKFNRQIAGEIEVSLPINQEGEPDYKFMTSFIEAVKKKVVSNLMSQIS